MNVKLIFKKLLFQILYFFIFVIAINIVGTFIPNPIYMLVLGSLAIAGLVYLRRSKRGEPEDEYLAGTTSDDLVDDIKYLFGGFSEFRAEVTSAAIVTGIMLIADIVNPLISDSVQFRFADILSFVFMYAVFFIADAAIWIILFRQYHSSRVKH